MNAFHQFESIVTGLLAFTKEFAEACRPAESSIPFAMPRAIEMGCLKTDPDTGVQVMLVLKDGLLDLRIQKVDSLKTNRSTK